MQPAIFLYFMKQLSFILALALWLVMPCIALAQNVTLFKGANAVINSEDTEFTVHSPASATILFKTRITILNEYGASRAKLYVPYNKLTKVNYIKATSYTLSGSKIKTLKSKDISDISNISNFSLFEDNRIKIADLTQPTYPYVVEFEYQTTNSNMLFYPAWFPQDSERLSVEKATLKISMPTGLELRYRELNMPAGVARATEVGKEIYTWQLENLEPVRSEPYAPPFAEMVPGVRTAPSDFEVEGYAGNMSTWQNYGQWINKLNKGRDVLPEATKAKIAALVADAPTTEEKVERIYKYMQNNTRYISIQLGIGGWQPFEASFVDSKGYGDCKALTNYTQAMLSEAGIASHHALIRAGEDIEPILADFPGQQFNHVILSVPMQQDTLWLECTSQIESAGYAGSHTGSRKALLVTPDGGKLVNTPDYMAVDNARHRSAVVTLDEKGNGKARVQTRYTGLEHEDRRDVMLSASAEDQRKWLYRNISIPSFEVNDFSFALQKGRLPQVTETLDMSLRQCATISGKRIFLAPNLMNKWTSIPNSVENRKWDVVRASAYTNTDTIVYELPAGYALEHKPNDTTYKTEFGDFTSSIKVEGNKVTYVRTLQMHKGRFKPEVYAQMLEFMNNIVKADGQQVVFVKNIP